MLAFCELPSRPAMHRGVAAPWGNLRSLCYERLQARNAAAGHRIAAFVLSAAVHSWIEADVGSARVWYAKLVLAYQSLLIHSSAAAVRTTYGCSPARLNCLKPRSLNFLPKRDGAAMIQTSSSGCDKAKMRQLDLW